MKMVAAPVSLADFDKILGVSPSASTGVAGCGGVGVVEAVGAGSKLSVGDYVVPNCAGFGMFFFFFVLFCFVLIVGG